MDARGRRGLMYSGARTIMAAVRGTSAHAHGRAKAVKGLRLAKRGRYELARERVWVAPVYGRARAICAARRRYDMRLHMRSAQALC